MSSALTLPLAGEAVCANVAKRGFHGIRLHTTWQSILAGLLSAAVRSRTPTALSHAALPLGRTAVLPLLGGLIFFLARLAQTGAKVLEQGPLVYLGEISYSIYMICVPWKIVFVNLASRILQISDERLPLGLWLVFLVGVVPLAACSYHLIENPARARMKLWSDSWDARRRAAAPA